MYLIKKNTKFFPLLLIVSAMSGCFGGKTEGEYLTQAKASIEKGEINKAIINLKNVVMTNGKNAEGRYLLGKSYIGLGLWVSAEKELELAHEYEYDLSKVIPLLAKSYYHLGDIKGLENLVERADMLDEDTQAALKTFVAITFIKEEYFDQGLNYLTEVVERDYDSKYTKLSKAWQHGLNNELDQALKVIDSILASDSQFAEAIEYKAYLHFKQQDMVTSAQYFGQYIAIHPQAHELRMMYALALVYAEQYSDSEQQVDLLLKGMPDSPKLNEIKAQTRFADNDYKKAKQHAETAVRTNSGLVLAKVIAGVSAYQLKQLESAYSYLNSVKDSLSYEHPAKKLFNDLRLQMGYEDELYNELSNTTNDRVDVDTLSLSANELFKIGKANEANALLAKAAEKEPKNSNVSYQQGMFQFYNNDPSATAFFEKAVANNPGLESASSMLLLEHLKNKEYDKAFEIADTVDKSNSELGLTYRGIIYSHQGNLPLAKKSYQQALELNGNNYGVTFKLGQVFEIENDIDSAIQQYQSALESNLRYPLAVSSLLKISLDPKYTDQVQIVFEKLNNENDTKHMSHIYLASFYVVQNNLKKAEVVINEGLTLIPNNFNLLMLKAKVQANAKDFDSSLLSLDQLLELSPNNINVLVAKASILDVQGNTEEAIKVQKAALKLMPTSVSTKLGLVNLHIKKQDISSASNILEGLILAGKKSFVIDRLRGKVAFLNRDYQRAEAILSQTFEMSKSADVALELATSLHNLDRSVEALQIIETYKSSTTLVELDVMLKQAEILESSDPQQALNIYNTILEKSGRHFAMLNNIAMIYFKLNKPIKAVEFSKEAYEKAQSNTTVQNTYGLALLGSKDFVNAEKYLKQAFLKNQNNEDYKVHYAKALLEMGKVEESNALVSTVSQQSLSDFTVDMYKKLVK